MGFMIKVSMVAGMAATVLNTVAIAVKAAKTVSGAENAPTALTVANMVTEEIVEGRETSAQPSV